MAATRWALVAAGTVLVAGLGSGVASAVEPAATPTLALSVASGPPGTALTAKGAHFGAGHAVDLLVDRTSVGTAYAGATGSFTARISIPKSARPGRHTVSAVSGTRSATASFLVRTDWPQYRGDAGRTGANPTENVITASTVRTLKPAWQVRTPDDQGLVAVAGGAVYLPSATTLTALDAATGATRWTQHAQFGFFTAVAVGGGRLVTVNGNHVVALAPATGAVLWTSPLAGQLLSQPVVTPNMIFIEGDDNRDVGRVWGIDPATGAIRWTSVPPLENFGVSMPAYADGRVFAGTIGKLRAFDAGTGALLWTAPVDDALNRQTLVVTGGTVYFVGNHVNAFDAATGTHRWTTLLGNEVDTNPAVAGGLLYVGTTGDSCPSCFRDIHHLYALDATTGAIRWEFTDRTAGFGDPVVAGGLVYASNADLRAFDPRTGRVVWLRHNLGVQAVVDGRLFANPAGRLLTAFVPG